MPVSGIRSEGTKLHWRGFNSAHDLRTLRKLAGLTQAELGKRAGFSVDAVKYQEARKGRIDGVSPSKFRSVLEEMGLSVPRPGEAPVTQPAPEPIPTTCGAKTRSGAPCQSSPVTGARRCKLHGGLSTGPKTKKGRARIAEAQRQRWAGTDQNPSKPDIQAPTPEPAF